MTSDINKPDNCQGRELMAQDGYTLIECEKCEFAHITPFPDQKTIADLYKDKYYEINKPNYCNHADRDSEWLKFVYKLRLNTIKSTLRRDKIRVLDVGSGPGKFLLACKDNGVDALGLEPSKAAFHFSKSQDLNVFNTSYLDFNQLKNDRFDCIHCSEVMEHMLDPKEFLSWCKKIVKPDGCIAISIPLEFNDFQIELNKQLGKAWWFQPSEHYNYWTKKSFKNLLSKSGYKLLHESSSFPVEVFALMGLDYISKPKLGSEVHAMRKKFELLMQSLCKEQFLTELQTLLAKHNIGRTFFTISSLK